MSKICHVHDLDFPPSFRHTRIFFFLWTEAAIDLLPNPIGSQYSIVSPINTMQICGGGLAEQSSVKRKRKQNCRECRECRECRVHPFVGKFRSDGDLQAAFLF